MNRGDAYKILAKELESLRCEGYHAIVPRVEQPARQTIVRIGEEDVLVETSVRWADQKKRSLRVVATAGGPSWWKLERLEESIVICLH
jgi:hypothetical protein